MYTYSAYDLQVHSEIELPELIVSSEVAPDVTIKVRNLKYSPLENISLPHAFQFTSDGLYIFWEGVGTFLVSQGHSITIEPSPETDEDRLRLFILGAAIGVILHQRGYLVLHGSAVDINGKAVIFLGDKGWGKSTLAAALNRQGYELIGDDVIALDLSKDHQPWVIPAFPQLKLWPDAVKSLGTDPSTLPSLVPHLEKRNWCLTEGFSTCKLPLHQIFILGQAPRLSISELSPQKILRYLYKNSYVTRFDQELLQESEATHLLNLTQLANCTPIHHLLRPSNLDLLPDTIRLIETHLNRSVQTV
ncbi:hypothetical protein GS597_16830 [Synechococcales cyanobacterium C]|uniref:HPr kinase/phosphorylase C-terminal domain-containing protein n=1 Tax=Petrachloros mirabilis ULC683 TaxID=2781853 RepID=A0A8K2A1T9_9CYAN|nr:hypothetical protein [Petrachloros mirabilis]NCJ08141.1 hypothetical protein [Petrachloros mirabilis ULC683]